MVCRIAHSGSAVKSGRLSVTFHYCVGIEFLTPFLTGLPSISVSNFLEAILGSFSVGVQAETEFEVEAEALESWSESCWGCEGEGEK